MDKYKIIFAALVFCFYASTVKGSFEFNVTDYTEFLPVNKNGKVVYMKEDLITKLKEEEQTWHWTPWLATRTKTLENVVYEIDCMANSVENFPDAWLTEEQLLRGGFLLYVFMGIYSFTLLAIVCGDYFLLSIEMICEDLDLPANVAAATFMAVGTSIPEFFINVISTFISESDMGIGNIVGSALFNALGVAAIGGLAASKAIAIDKRPVSRDVIIYMVNVSVLVGIVWDGVVTWGESIILAVLYVVYFIIMFNSSKIFIVYDMIVGKCTKKPLIAEGTLENGISKTPNEGIDNPDFIDNGSKSEGLDVTADVNNDIVAITQKDKNEIPEEESVKIRKSLWRYPTEKTVPKRIWWVYTWPLKLILTLTVPSPKTFRKLYPLTFVMSIIWIGVNSYFVSWSMTVIGHTLSIPDSIMGMTFLAFGSCLPEACSIFIMSRRGQGSMGVSNALGANSLAILFALGVPWLIRTLVLLGNGEEGTVHINSAGIDFVVGSLLLAVVCLWITLYLCRFLLRKVTGYILACIYIVFIAFAILVEMGVILYRSVSLC